MSKPQAAFDLKQISVNDWLSNDPISALDGAEPAAQGATIAPTDPGAAPEGQAQEPAPEPGTDPTPNPSTDPQGAEGGEGGEPAPEDGDPAEPALSVIQELSQLLGYEVEGEVQDDVQGIAELTKQYGTKIGEQYVAQFFDQFPDVKEYLTYRAQGGDPGKYFQVSQQLVDFTQMTEEQIKSNKDLQKKVVVENYSDMGYDQEAINDLVKDLEDSGLLEKQSLLSKKRMDGVFAKRKAETLAQQQQVAAAKAEEDKQAWTEIGTTIKKGELRGFVIPESEKQGFYDWMARPVDNQGRTQRMIDMEKLDTQSSLTLEYLYYRQFDLGKLVGSKATSKAPDLRARLNQQSKPSVTQTFNKGSQSGHQRTEKLPGLNELGFGS